MKQRTNELAPCGVYCGACPSFEKSCYGCSSEDDAKNKRKSRCSCKIRMCCYNEKKVNFCFECTDFPCGKIHKKLIKSHPGDPRYKYRHELEDICTEFKEKPMDEFLQNQKERWLCPSCGGTVHFYRYTCSQCGKEVEV